MRQDKILNFGLRVKLYPGNGGQSFKERLRRIICTRDWMSDTYSQIRSTGINCERIGYDGAIVIASEQAPNPDSRVTLTGELDQFGLRRAELTWRLSPIDKQTLQRGAWHFSKQFANQGWGRVRIAEWLLSADSSYPGLEEETGGHHHMGTTRMAISPREGVVDSRQRVFGVDNLYLAGSSVFPSVGHANPTFTITQMTLRLAQHLRGVL